ncbi:MAG TPA: FkbM family methyltransferase [Solirubrobacteraceae bacterium]|nr:FkbM family methyltransferase [Solirubrobacteraceae bacterium]
MDVYGQDPELALLRNIIACLNDRSMIDVGAEQGSLAHAMLAAGVQELHAFDPHHDNAEAIRTRFAGERRVTVHELAISDGDGTGELHISSRPDGSPLSFGHTLLEREDTDEVAWGQTVAVERRSLGSLLEAAEIPSHVGILKVDTEGHDLAVVQGMGTLEADVVMVEHWTELPNGLGRCPWTAQQMLDELASRGYTHFGFIVHRGEFVTLKWDDAEVEPGAMGNLIFFHERVVADMLGLILESASQLAEQAVRVGQMYMRAAVERLALVDELSEIAEARRQALELTTAKIKEKAAELELLRGPK